MFDLMLMEVLQQSKHLNELASSGIPHPQSFVADRGFKWRSKRYKFSVTALATMGRHLEI